MKAHSRVDANPVLSLFSSKTDIVLCEIQPIVAGAWMSLTWSWMFSNCSLSKIPSSFHSDIRYFPLPRNKLCTGSTKSCYTMSKYGRRNSSVYLSPYILSNSWWLAAVWVFGYLDTCYTWRECVQTHHNSSIVFKTDSWSNFSHGNAFIHFEQLWKEFTHFFDAGRSQDTTASHVLFRLIRTRNNLPTTMVFFTL